MKKIINGRKYDTDTATKLAEWDNGASYTDFSYCSETLYRKKTGEYFLHGEGGAYSQYASTRGDGWAGYGETIRPLTIDEAKEWSERHMDGDSYEAEFGEVEE